ncbi:MAG: PEP-CTERM system histidine kinase PrsK [Proteobacteria bacterium]|jgi:putative PEP-CTERM system histidine kinase|nr:PEP-CTERM system histidine kinase PrsK [Pseudomonadota bacterium]
MSLTDFAVWGYALAALVYGGFALYLYAAWRGAAVGGCLLLTVILSGVWALGCLWFASHPSEMAFLWSSVLDMLRGGGWFAFLLILLRPLLGGVWKRFLITGIMVFSVQLVGSVVFGWILVQDKSALDLFFGLVPVRDMSALKLIFGGSLAGAVLGLVLIEQLYRGVPVDVRRTLKPLCMGLGAAYMFELYLFADAFLFGRPTSIIWAVRGPAHALIVPLVAISGARNPSWSLRMSLSREAVFHSTALGLSGLYLLAVSGIGFYVRSYGGEWGYALQTVLLFAALLLLAVLMSSSAQRARLRVLINKHLFPYRYDYRAEWLRFTHSLSSADGQSNLGQSVITALANLVESPGGALWLRGSAGGDTDYTIQASVSLPVQAEVREPPESSLMNFMRKRGWVVNLEEYRRNPANYPGLVLPDWLASRFPDAWLLIPLIGGAGLIGFVLLSSPRTRFDIDWEVLDLLKTAQHQAASDLERMLSAEDLLEARKFESFNRMTAFVVHDLKNLVAQLSLMLRNAERHKDNPEFQADMLETVAHVETKMRELMVQLQEKRSIDPPRVLNLVKQLEKVHRARQEQHPGLELDIPLDCDTFMVLAHPERLERVIGHIVQNAIEATPESGKVCVTLEASGSERVRVVVADTGCGMSEDFIREHLSRPFQTTKSSGMGIGVFETRQYIRELGGDVSYESRKGIGTRVIIELPLHARLDSEHEEKSDGNHD